MPAKKRTGILRLRGPLWALAAKEMLVVRRDLRKWMEALYMLVVMVVVTVGPALDKNGPASLPGETLAVYFGLGAAYMVSFSLAGTVALGCLGREGRNWPLLRSLPVTGEQILGGKALGVAVLVIIPVLAITLAVNLFLGLRGFA